MQELQDELLTTREAAALLKVAPGTLEVWRSSKRYPLPFVRVGRAVRYSRAACFEFLKRRTFNAV